MEETRTKTKKKPHRRAEKLLIEWTIALLIALAAALLLTEVLFVNALIPSESMENTIHIGDRVIGFRLSFLFSGPKRGDIIMFEYPDDVSRTYIKRVIGLPGDTVEIRLGKVYVNGEDTPLDEPYLKEEPRGDFGPYAVPEDSYFVLGDNRQQSWDSRYWHNTYVRHDQLIGRAWFELFPDFKWL